MEAAGTEAAGMEAPGRTPRSGRRAVLAVEGVLVLAALPLAGPVAGLLGRPPSPSDLPVGRPVTATVVYLAPHHRHDVGLDLRDGRDPLSFRLLDGTTAGLEVGQELRGTLVELCRSDGTAEVAFLPLSQHPSAGRGQGVSRPAPPSSSSSASSSR